MPLEHQHDAVAAPDAEGGKIVGRPAGGLFHIPEGEAPLRAVLRDVEHRQLFGLFPAERVDDVKGEVEPVFVPEGDGLHKAVFVLRRPDEALGHAGLPVGGALLRGGKPVGRRLQRRFLLRTQDDRVEQTIFAVGRDHAVRDGAVIVDAVALVQDLDMLADLHLHAALDDEIAFLPDVAGQLDIGVERAVGILVFHKQGIGDPVLEVRCHVVVDHLVCLLDLLPLACARKRVGAELRTLALDEVGHVDAKGQRAPVEKRERQIASARLAEEIFLDADAGLPGHLGRREAGDLTKLADTARHLLNFVVKSCQLLICHCATSWGKEKTRLKDFDRIRIFETS